KDANETTIAGVRITLTGPVAQTLLTSPDGSYRFTGLTAGTYTLTETQPLGVGDGKDTAGSLGGNTTVNDVISAINVGVGRNGINYNFGERPTGINGRAFLDLNNNGLVEATEVGIPDVLVTIVGVDINGNPVNRSTLSAFDGRYRFPDLTPGTYT